MRTRAARVIVSPVTPKRTRLTVELDSRAEPIMGKVLEDGGRAHEFSGYMGLIETFERLRPPASHGGARAEGPVTRRHADETRGLR
jgi:hypothetical protein